MNLRITVTVLAVALWTLARLPEISPSQHPGKAIALASSSPEAQGSGLLTGWEVKYLRPRTCPLDYLKTGYRVEFDKSRGAFALHKVEQGNSSLVMTDEQEDNAFYIIYWKASARAVFPPNCEYTIDPIRP